MESLPYELINHIVSFSPTPQTYLNLLLSGKIVSQHLDKETKETIRRGFLVGVKVMEEDVIKKRYHILPNGKRDGLFEKWGGIRLNGVYEYKREVFYVNGKRQGLLMRFETIDHWRGDVYMCTCTINYINGKKQGESIHYYRELYAYYECTYVDDEKQEWARAKYLDGSLMSECRYDRGVVKEAKRYHAGSLKTHDYFLDDSNVFKEYHTDGSLYKLLIQNVNNGTVMVNHTWTPGQFYPPENWLP